MIIIYLSFLFFNLNYFYYQKMKLSNKKKFFFSSVFVTFIISTVIFLYTIKNNIRLFNVNFLNNFNNNLLDHLKKINYQNYKNFIQYDKKIIDENNNQINYSDNIEESLRSILIPFTIKINNETASYEKNIEKRNDLFKNKIKIFKDKKTKKKISIRIKNEKDSLNDLLSLIKLIQNVSGIYTIHKNYTKIYLNDSVHKDSRNEAIINHKNYTASNLLGNSTPKGAYEIIDQKIFIFKHINFIYLVEKDSPQELMKNNKNNLLKIAKELSTKILGEKNNKINFYIKIAYVDNKANMQNYPDLYADLNKYNSKYTLDELYDEKYLNILIFDSKSNEINDNKKLNILYNKDIKNHIFCFDFDSLITNRMNSDNESAVDLFNFLIVFNTLNIDSANNIMNNYDFENIMELFKVSISDEVHFFKMIAKILFDLDKLNKFIANYESSRNINMIKQKVK